MSPRAAISVGALLGLLLAACEPVGERHESPPESPAIAPDAGHGALVRGLAFTVAAGATDDAGGITSIVEEGQPLVTIRVRWALAAKPDSQRMTVTDSLSGAVYLNAKVAPSWRTRTFEAPFDRIALVRLTAFDEGRTILDDRRAYLVGSGELIPAPPDTVPPESLPPEPEDPPAPRALDSVVIGPLTWHPETKRVIAIASWGSSEPGVVYGGTTGNGPIGPTQTSHEINWLKAPGDTVTFYACPYAVNPRTGVKGPQTCVYRGMRIPAAPVPEPPDSIAPPDTTPTDTVVQVPPDTVVIPPPLDTARFHGVAEMPRVYLDTEYRAPPGRVIPVAAGADLQAALNAAARGDILELAAGATFRGNFVLPAKPGTGTIVLRSAGPLPPAGIRVTPATAAAFARLVTTNSMPALRTAAGSASGDYRIMGLEITSTADMSYSIVHLGDYEGAATAVDMLPARLALDRVYVHGGAANGIQRCIVLNARASAVIDSWVDECKIAGFDSQAIVAWNTPGPLKFVNNHLAGAGENLMIGGADPRIPGLVGSDIEIRRNHFYKPFSWKGAGWTVKNAFELKNARRVLVEANVFENTWSGGQTGFAVVLKSINDGGRCTWCVTEDVTMRWNRIINAPGGVHLVAVQAYNGGGAIPMRRVVIDQLDMVGVGYPPDGVQVPGATYQMFQVNGGPSVGGGLTSMHISHVTNLTPSKQIIMFTGAPGADFRFLDGIYGKTTYGVFGDGGTQGTSAFARYAPGYVVTRNVFLGASCASYPPGNTCPAAAPATTTAGVDRAELERRLAGVVVAP